MVAAVGLEPKRQRMKLTLRIVSGLLLAFVLLCGSGIAPSAYNLIQANGTPAGIGSTLNFANGTGITWACTTVGAVTTCTATGSGGGSSFYQTVQANGSSATQAPTLNFANGTGITWACTTVSMVTNCTATNTGSSGGTALANYSQSFSSATSVTLTDNAGTTSKVVACYDGSSNEIIPQSVTITSANVTTVTFSTAQSGYCVVNSSGVSTGGGLVLATATKTATYTYTASDYLIIGNTTSGSFTVNLEATPTAGQIHVLKKSVAANTLTLGGNGNNIDGAATLAVTTQYTSYTVQFDGTQWWIE
jgi:hypothetical protein